MLDGFPIEKLTAPVLVGITVLLLLLGRLVPRSTYRDKADEAEKWRKAYEVEREARAISDAQTAQLLEFAKTTHNIVVAMASTAERIRQSGGADAVPYPTK